ncbi:MAG TPA: flippase-like domain-containing protein [Candidatus Binatus sp.]|nr:flippase-like domain-containing protein [Candidatus Binatus sp.]
MNARPADGQQARRRRVFLTGALTIGIGLLVLPMVLADGRELLRTAAGIEPYMLALPAALTLLSYAAMSRSYQDIADAAGCHLSFRSWLRITFVSNTVNYLVTSAGLSGFAVRMYLLSQQGITSGRAVLISLVQTFLTNFTLLFFILAGFATLLLGHSLPEVALAATAGVVVLFAATLAFGAVLVFHRRLRRRALFVLAEGTHRLLRATLPRWSPGRVRIWRFQHNLNEGFEFLLARKEHILAPAAWILLDWVLTLAILWAAFRAVHYPIGLGLVVIGFAVGICLSLISLVPAGLGVMDSSMTAVFVGLSVPLERAVVAVLIFRVAYYLLPLLVSLCVFHRVMLEAAHRVSSAARVNTVAGLTPPPPADMNPA